MREIGLIQHDVSLSSSRIWIGSFAILPFRVLMVVFAVRFDLVEDWFGRLRVFLASSPHDGLFLVFRFVPSPPPRPFHRIPANLRPGLAEAGYSGTPSVSPDSRQSVALVAAPAYLARPSRAP
jgi:hypothetical protein